MERTVAFLDVLGFKALVQALPHADLLKKYRQLQAAAYKATSVPVFPKDHRQFDADAHYEDHEIKRARTAHVLMASDSIVVYPEADDHNGAMSVLACVRALLAVGLQIGMPLRGGVARGTLDLLASAETSDQGPHIGRFDGLVGRGLVEAYLIEAQYEWSGAVVDQSVPDYLHGIELHHFEDGVATAWHQARSSRLIVPAAAPVKVPEARSLCSAPASVGERGAASGGYRVEPQQRWAVAWPAAIGHIGAVEHLSEEAVAAAFTTAGNDLGPRERAKRDATLDFMRAVQRDVGSMPLVAPPILP